MKTFMKLIVIISTALFWSIHGQSDNEIVKEKRQRLTADGLPFAIDQKDWQPRNFTMYGMKFEDTQGFVSREYLPLDNHGYAELIESCDFEEDSMPLHVYSPLGTTIYYPDSDVYDKFQGYDMIPENKDNYIKGESYDLNLNFVDGKKFWNQTIMMKRCRVPTTDGGAWHAQRVGPFVTTGGYSWVTIGWPDWAMLSEVIPKYPQGIDVEKIILGAVKADGTRLNLPPIHTHHVHTLAAPAVRPRLKQRFFCVNSAGLGLPVLDKLVTESKCYNFTFFWEQHGDPICQPVDDGIDCTTQGDKNARRLSTILDLEGELNDVRPANSEQLEWYYQTAVHWKPGDLSKPTISQMNVGGPGTFDPAHQLTSGYTALSDPSQETFHTYTSQLRHGGELVRIKTHSHSAIFQSSMFLSGKYEDFGLDDPKFTPEQSYLFVPTKGAGFDSNEDLAHFILNNMKKSQITWDEKCGEHGKELYNSICARPRPDWICGAVVDYATVNYFGVDYPFDRRPPTWCKPWTFKEGDPFVVVGFNKIVDSPPYAHLPGYMPKFMNQHNAFFISFLTPERGQSLFFSQLCTHWGTFHEFNRLITPTFLCAQFVSILLWKGPPNSESTLVFIQNIFSVIFLLLTVGIGYVLYRVANKANEYFHAETAAYSHKYQPVIASADDDEGIELTNA